MPLYALSRCPALTDFCIAPPCSSTGQTSLSSAAKWLALAPAWPPAASHRQPSRVSECSRSRTNGCCPLTAWYAPSVPCWGLRLSSGHSQQPMATATAVRWLMHGAGAAASLAALTAGCQRSATVAGWLSCVVPCWPTTTRALVPTLQGSGSPTCHPAPQSARCAPQSGRQAYRGPIACVAARTASAPQLPPHFHFVNHQACTSQCHCRSSTPPASCTTPPSWSAPPAACPAGRAPACGPTRCKTARRRSDLAGNRERRASQALPTPTAHFNQFLGFLLLRVLLCVPRKASCPTS